MDVFRYVDGGLLVVGSVALACAVGLGLFVLRRDGLVAALTLGAACLLMGWTFVVVVFTVLPLSLGNPNGDVNLVPGRGIAGEWSNINRSLGMVNVFGNVVLFVPGGFLLAGLLRRRPWVAVLVLALASAAVEVLQYLGGARAADIDDVILNTAGAAAGVAVLLVIRTVMTPGRARAEDAELFGTSSPQA